MLIRYVPMLRRVFMSLAVASLAISGIASVIDHLAVWEARVIGYDGWNGIYGTISTVCSTILDYSFGVATMSLAIYIYLLERHLRSLIRSRGFEVEPLQQRPGT